MIISSNILWNIVNEVIIMKFRLNCNEMSNMTKSTKDQSRPIDPSSLLLPNLNRPVVSVSLRDAVQSLLNGIITLAHRSAAHSYKRRSVWVVPGIVAVVFEQVEWWRQSNLTSVVRDSRQRPLLPCILNTDCLNLSACLIICESEEGKEEGGGRKESKTNSFIPQNLCQGSTTLQKSQVKWHNEI